MKWSPILLLLIIAFFSRSSVYAELPKSESFPSPVSALKIEVPLEFCGERVPVEVQEVKERMEKELLLTVWDRPQAILWLKRSPRYLRLIEEMLKENRMPDDLKYVTIAESALRPHVRSRKGAVGFWQFITATGRKYGLEINTRIDERRNVFASTQAAIRYLNDLHKIFGSWTLSVAAYNMGEEKLMAETLEQQTIDYYQLYLPLETQRYIFRILSAKLILSDPENYGFNLLEDDYYPPLEFDRINLDCFQDTPIRIVAQAANTYFKVIKDLNPEVRGHYLQSGNHEILIPKGASKGFHARYEPLLKKWLAERKDRIYVVKKGDSLTGIAERFNIPLPALLIWNSLNLKSTIHPGDELIIYKAEVEKVDIGNEENNREARPSGND
jgi:hypothetical protein